MRAETGVGVFSVFKPGQAGGAILAFVVHAAQELDVTMVTAPGEHIRLHLGTVTGEVCHAVLAPSTVLAWLAFTLVDVYFTYFACNRC